MTEAARTLADKLASLKWHLTENTVNREIIFDLIDDCQRLSRSPLPGTREEVARADDPLADLVERFSRALLAKLRLAQANGRSGWERDDWEAHCQQGLLRHIEKGDPRDIAAYCAFMWHHGWAALPPTPPSAGTREEVAQILRENFYTGEPGETEAIKAATDAIAALPPAPMPERSVPSTWEVEIRVDGTSILTLGSSHHSGIENIEDYASDVENAAQHLLSFIGRPMPEREGMREMLENILKANDDFRAGMPDGWDGDPLQDACNAARAALASHDDKAIAVSRAESGGAT